MHFGYSGGSLWGQCRHFPWFPPSLPPAASIRRFKGIGTPFCVFLFGARHLRKYLSGYWPIIEPKECKLQWPHTRSTCFANIVWKRHKRTATALNKPRSAQSLRRVWFSELSHHNTHSIHFSTKNDRAYKETEKHDPFIRKKRNTGFLGRKHPWESSAIGITGPLSLGYSETYLWSSGSCQVYTPDLPQLTPSGF